MNNISEKDFKILNQIIEITESISIIYDKLYTLESNGQINSEEYKKNINYIKMLKEDYENKLYKSLNLNLEKIMYICEYLKTDILEIIDNEDDITLFYPKNRITKRIINTLYYRLATDKSIYKTMITSIMNIPTDVINSMANERETISKIMQNDRKYVVLSILFDKNLLKEKYNYLFINRVLEDKLLQSDFIISNPIILESSFNKSNLLGFAIDYVLGKEVIERIASLNQINDIIYEENKANLVYSSIILRSLFALISKEIIGDINYTYHERIESSEYQNDFPNNSKIEHFICSIFKIIDSDKKRVLTLSNC